MTSSGAGINYRDTFFEYPELDKIHGEPTPDALLVLKNQLKANATSVPSNLSDGLHGHIFLVLTPAQYALFSNDPFIHPLHPGVLHIPANTTGPQAQVLRERHKEELRVFREVTGVDKALKQQITKAIHPDYLLAIRNRQTNSLSGTIAQVLGYLFTTYGHISISSLETKEDELRAFSYHPGQPVDVVFNAVDDLVEFADLAGQPMSQRQTISRAYVILHKTNQFDRAITEWNRKLPVEKTWINFKTHFRTAHRELRESAPTTLAASELHEHNAALVKQVVEGVRDTLMPSSHEDDPTVEILQQIVNSTTQNSTTQQKLLDQLKLMHDRMQTMEIQLASTTQSSNYFHQGGHQGGYQGGYQNGHQGGRGGSHGNRNRRYHRYCWTHGGCAHDGAHCRYKATNHKQEATFQNKLGGSTRNCLPGNVAPPAGWVPPA
jgi:hypothetical protein